jgi:hypothetical protein
MIDSADGETDVDDGTGDSERARPDLPCTVCGTPVEQQAKGRPRIYCSTRCAEQAKASRTGVRAEGGLDHQLAEAHRLADRMATIAAALGGALNTELSASGVEARIAAIRSQATAKVAAAQTTAADAEEKAERAQATAQTQTRLANEATARMREAEAHALQALEAARAAERERDEAVAIASAATAQAKAAADDLAVQAARMQRLEADLETAVRAVERVETDLRATRETLTETNGRLAVAVERHARAETDLRQLADLLTAEKVARKAAEQHGTGLERQLVGLQAALEHAQAQAHAEREARETIERRADEAMAKAERGLRDAVAREREAHRRETAALEKALAAASTRADRSEQAVKQATAAPE